MRIAMTTVRNSGHLGRFFASWRLGVFALNHRTVPAELCHGPDQRDREDDSASTNDSEVSFLTPRREDAKTQRDLFGPDVLSGVRSPNQAAPAKPAGASLFDSQPFERGLAEPQRWANALG